MELEEYRRAEEIEAALTGRGIFLMLDGRPPKYIGQCGGFRIETSESNERVSLEWVDDRLAEWLEKRRRQTFNGRQHDWLRFSMDGKLAYDLADVRVCRMRVDQPDTFSPRYEEGYGRSPLMRSRPAKIDCMLTFSHYNVTQLESNDD